MLLTLALLAAQAQDLTLTPGAVLNGANVNGRATSDCDDFNRANGPMNGNWTPMAGTYFLDNNQGLGSGGNSWMQSTTGNCAAQDSTVSIRFEPNTSGALKYSAAVMGIGGADNYYVKVQSQSSTLYNYLGFYVGFNGGGGSYGQFAAITPVQWGRMDVWYDVATDKMVLDIDEFDDSSVDYTYTSNGPASSVGGLTGTGHGLGTYGDQRFDNWQINGGCGGGPVFTLAKTGSCPGPVTMTTTNGAAGAIHVFLYGIGSGPFTVPAGPCAGTVLNMNGPTIGALVGANGSGSAAVSVNSKPAWCGLTIQVIEAGTCATTNTVTL